MPRTCIIRVLDIIEEHLCLQKKYGKKKSIKEQVQMEFPMHTCDKTSNSWINQIIHDARLARQLVRAQALGTVGERRHQGQYARVPTLGAQSSQSTCPISPNPSSGEVREHTAPGVIYVVPSYICSVQPEKKTRLSCPP